MRSSLMFNWLCLINQDFVCCSRELQSWNLNPDLRVQGCQHMLIYQNS